MATCDTRMIGTARAFICMVCKRSLLLFRLEALFEPASATGRTTCVLFGTHGFVSTRNLQRSGRMASGVLRRSRTLVVAVRNRNRSSGDTSLAQRVTHSSSHGFSCRGDQAVVVDDLFRMHSTGVIVLMPI